MIVRPTLTFELAKALQTERRMERYISLVGLFAMVGLAWLMSSHKRQVPWRIVVIGMLLQFSFAVMILKTPGGNAAFTAMGAFFTHLLGYVDEGARFVFGPKFQDYRFAFQVLPTIVFFSSLMSILYYMGLMQRVVEVFAWVMQKSLGTSGAESLSAAANIFVGQTEAPLVIRPYVATMTQSELMAVMVGGFATIAGGVLAAYTTMLEDFMPDIAGHLITASVISAPAALLIAKVMQPETEQPETLGSVRCDAPRQGSNVIEAAAIGATDGLKLALNVAAMLIAFLALIAMLDGLIGWVGSWFGQAWSLSAGFGYAFAPFAWLMGVPWADCLQVGELLGLKMFATEFAAYQRYGEMLGTDHGAQLSERSRVIITYALCGFSNFGSIGIQIGGIGGIAPERRGDLARLGLRAMLGGTLACCMTACVAALLI